MTKKEIAFIERRAGEFFRWAREEREAADVSRDTEERQGHLSQANINDCAGNTLINLLADLTGLEK